MDSARPPRGPGGGTEVAAVLKARANALNVVECLLRVLDAPDRHSAAVVAAAKLLLDVAGVGSLLADERHTELLRMLRKHTSPEAYGEVVRALADHSGVPDERTGSTLDN